jgi:hypothetical protein
MAEDILPWYPDRSDWRHGDAHNVPLGAWLDVYDSGVLCHLCDGINECMKDVRCNYAKVPRPSL